jgi:glycosyltransferase involved in cell wall biosynthesis
VYHKLIIQIPCLNEAKSLPVTLASLPRSVPGFDVVEWLVIDDGSSDDTVAVARREGVDHILSFGYNRGLARAFMAGLEFSLKRGADVIVNTDADNQYAARCISDLVRPILEKRALIVVGARPIRETAHFSPVKKMLQRLGSWLVKRVSRTDIADAPSGFRAIHRDAALQLNVFNDYTYTLETVIQAGRKNLPIVSVPVATNPDLRPSRLVRNTFNYVWRSVITIFRIFVIYKPLRSFFILACLLALPAIFYVARFLYFYATGNGGGHVQSLVLSAVLFGLAGIAAMGGILADLIATNRLLLEDLRMRALRAEVEAITRRSADAEQAAAEAVMRRDRQRAEA